MGIGPSTKETTLHHFRDPLLNLLSSDKDIDLLGVIIVGTPQDMDYKYFVGERVASIVQAARCDGVIISVDGWGNSNIDFAHTIEKIGEKDVPIVGLSFIGKQAQFVVTNKYMDTILDFNKSKLGIETEVVGENNISKKDAEKALAFLKLKMNKNR